MATDILLDPTTHDIDISKGGKLISDNATSLGQRLKIALLLRKGEWLPNVLAGVPYQQKFFNTKNNKEFIDSYLRNYIANIPDVVSIVSYSSNIVNRKLEVNVRVSTTAGTIVNYIMEV